MGHAIKLAGITLGRPESDLGFWSARRHEEDVRQFVSEFLKQQPIRAERGRRPGEPRVDLTAVCGSDDRVENRNITVQSSVAERATCHLAVTLDDGRLAACTGFFVAPRKVVTAAHCLYNKEVGVWANRVIVRPGLYRNERGEIVAPFKGEWAGDIRVPQQWVDGDGHGEMNFDFDWGLISLASEELYARAGQPFFQLWAASDSEVGQNRFGCWGYPDLAPFPNQRQYASALESMSGLGRNIIYGRQDNSRGNSGGPLAMERDVKTIGIVSHGPEDCRAPNGFTRITADVKQTLETYVWP